MTERATQILQNLLKDDSRSSVSPIDLLISINQSPSRADGLASDFIISKSTVYRYLDELQQAGLVRENPAEIGLYEITGTGAVIHHQIATQFESSDTDLWESLLYICGSDSPARVYDALQEQGLRKADIARGTEAPSRATVHRVITESTQRGLVETDEDGGYVLTAQGRTVLSEYNTLVEAVEIAQRHSILFDCIGPVIADIPLHAISSAEQIINEGTVPDQTILAIESLVADGITDVRGLRSFISLKLTEIFWPGIKSGTPHESIVTEQVIRNLPTTGRYWKFARHGLTASNVTVLVVPGIESFPYSLGILNEDTVVLGPAHPGQLVDTPTGLKSETIIGKDSELVQWAEEKYEEYRLQGQRPIQYLTKEILGKIRQGIGTNSPEVSEN